MIDLKKRTFSEKDQPRADLLEQEILSNKAVIVASMNYILEAKYQLMLLKYHETFEKEINVGTRRKPKKVIAKYGKYWQYVNDGDGVDNIRVERTEMYLKDGNKMFGKTQKFVEVTLENVNQYHIIL